MISCRKALPRPRLVRRKTRQPSGKGAPSSRRNVKSTRSPTKRSKRSPVAGVMINRLIRKLPRKFPSLLLKATLESRRCHEILSCYLSVKRMAAISLPTPHAAPKPRVWEPVKVWRRRMAAKIMRARVTNRNFSIISNDCFGGMAYEELGLRYESPFVGLFVLPEDYVRLLRNLKPACEQPIRFKERSRHERINVWCQAIHRDCGH